MKTGHSRRQNRTELEERMLIPTAVQIIGVIAVLNTHQYSFSGKVFLQRACHVFTNPLNRLS
jgi:hypothetical protein